MAQYIKGNFKLPRLIGLYGDLGSGKTTYTAGFAEGLGIVTKINSPTYLIIRRYSLAKFKCFFYHIDLYRYDLEDEILEAELYEIINHRQDFICIEWADKLPILLNQAHFNIKFEVDNSNFHKISITQVKSYDR